MANSSADLPRSPLAPSRLRWMAAWVLAFVATWPAPGIAETLLALGALFALGRLLFLRVRGDTGAWLGVPAWALTSVLFCAYWLPQLFSALDAADPGKALAKAATGLRYLPFMWLVAVAVAGDARRRTTFAGLAVIAGLWSLDALLQAVSGTSPLFWSLDQLKQLVSGHALCLPQDMAGVGRVNGVFGACNPKLGQVLASLSPFLLLWAGGRWGRVGWAAAALVAGVAIVLAGSRASWLSFGLVLLLTGWRLLGARGLALAVLAGVLGVAALGIGSVQVRERIVATLPALSGNADGVNSALAGRGRIWDGALCMVREHPFNGVGVRGFREAWPQCNPAPGQPAEWGGGPALHAHQLLLEVLAETGVLGLLLWLAGAAMAWRAWRYADAAARERARPAAVALLVTVFPFNTHLAFYSAFWGSVTLLLAALYAGSLLADERQ